MVFEVVGVVCCGDCEFIGLYGSVEEIECQFESFILQCNQQKFWQFECEFGQSLSYCVVLWD